MDLQTCIVLAVVVSAAAYVVRRLMRNAQGHSDGACDKCAPGDKRPH